MSEDIAEWCGYDSVFDMIRDNSSVEELLLLLCSYVFEDTDGWAHEIVEEIAKDRFEWLDEEQAIADHEDTQYQEHKDKLAGDK